MSKRTKITDPELEALRAQLNTRTAEQGRMALRRKVRIFYDLQRMRMQAAARGQPKADGAEVQLHEFDIAMLTRRAADLEAAEKGALKDVEEHLQTIPFYTSVLMDKSRFKGIGPTMAGVILSEFDIVESETVSRMWHFAGLAPTATKRCKHCHGLVKFKFDDRYGPTETMYEHIMFKPRKPKPGEEAVEAKPIKVCPRAGQTLMPDDIVDSHKTMKPTKGEKLTYNAFLRAKLIGVLGPGLLKCGSPYVKFYYDYKNRWIAAGKGYSDQHRHLAAIRYMVKMLLLDLWKAWREHEGLAVRPSYQEEKLGHTTSMKEVGA